MKTIGATALNSAEAIGELVANCIDARHDGQAVTVQVSIGSESLAVVDDASGMDLATLKEAIRLGVDMDAVTARASPRMGTYGLGMKTAAASLGDVWGIVTRPAAAPGTEYSVTFDLRDYGRRDRGTGAESGWSVDIEEGEPDPAGFLGTTEHGTAVWIQRLRSRDLMPGAFIDHLGRAYSPYITAHGDTITVNDTVVAPFSFDFVEGSRYAIDVVVNEELGWRAHGWVALDRKTHNRPDYGLNLYRQGQLVESWNKDFFRAHLMTSRILGEVHLDYVPVNFNKKGFETSSEAWRFTKEALKVEVKPAVDASQAMSRNRGDDTRVERALAKMREVLGNGGGGAPLGPTTGTPGGTDGDGEVEPDAVRVVAARGDVIHLPTADVRIDCMATELDSELLPWDYIYSPDRQEMVVVVNTSAAVFAKTTDVEFLACLAIADCIARVLHEQAKVPWTQARRVRDSWLHDAFVGGYNPGIGNSASRGAGAPS